MLPGEICRTAGLQTGLTDPLQTYLFSLLTPHLLLSPLLLLLSSLAGLACSVVGLGTCLVSSPGPRLLTVHGLGSGLTLALTLAAALSTALLLSDHTSELHHQNNSSSGIQAGLRLSRGEKRILRDIFLFICEILWANIQPGLQEENVTVLLGEWEEVQEVYQCCGLTGEEGYQVWLPLLPDSCCTIKYPHCGRDALATLNSDFANTFYDRIFPTGCLTVFR